MVVTISVFPMGCVLHLKRIICLQANHYYKLFITWTNQKIKNTFVQRNMFEFKHIKVWIFVYTKQISVWSWIELEFNSSRKCVNLTGIMKLIFDYLFLQSKMYLFKWSKLKINLRLNKKSLQNHTHDYVRLYHFSRCRCSQINVKQLISEFQNSSPLKRVI